MHNSKPGKDWNHGKPDHEGGMALNQLHRLNDISEMLLDMISHGDELPAWVQSKLTRAYTDLNDVFGYLEPQMDHEHEVEIETLTIPVTEAKKKGKCSGCKGKSNLWCNICRKRARGERAARPGEKGYPKTLDIE